ncbi:MAG: hypothetical protein ACP5I8_12800 [Phycisphaerae bacterium]
MNYESQAGNGMRMLMFIKIHQHAAFGIGLSALIGMMSTPWLTAASSRPVLSLTHDSTRLNQREADAKVRIVNGCPHLFINGQPTPPLALYVGIPIKYQPTLRQSAAEIRLAAAQGVNIIAFATNSLGDRLPSPHSGLSGRYQLIDRQCAFILKNDPHAWLLPRVWCGELGFCATHPLQQVAYRDGLPSDSSVASRLWYHAAAQSVTAFIEHIQGSKYASHVIGYHIGHGHTVEWFTPNYWKHPGFDYSVSNRLGFARWLRRHYHTDKALQGAWHDSKVSFRTATIPPPEPFTAYPFYQAKESRYVDYLNYQSDITADRIVRLAAVVKRVAAGRSLVVTFYGYDFELPTSDTADRALGRLLRCADIDAIASPVSYIDRQPGGSPAFMGPVDSATLHGKLWMLEDDTSTFLDTPDKGEAPGFSAHCANLSQTVAVHDRNFGQMMIHRLGTWWMDLPGTGWLNNAGIWANIGQLRKAYLKYAPENQFEPEVAVIYDERSPSYARVDPGQVLPLYPALVHYPTEFFHCGTSVGFYLLSDIGAPNFPHAKVIIFLNAWHVGAATRRIIREKLERGGRTLIWMYGDGFIRHGNVDTAAAGRLIGVTLRLRSAVGNLPGSEILANNALHLRGQLIAGLQGADAPSWSVIDSTAIPLGRYVHTHDVSIALRKFSAYQSIFIGDPSVAAPIWRALLPRLGVHVYLNTNDAFQTDGRLMMISSDGVAGMRKITLPHRSTVYNLISGQKLTDDARHLKIVLRRFQTMLLGVHPSRTDVSPYKVLEKSNETQQFNKKDHNHEHVFKA